MKPPLLHLFFLLLFCSDAFAQANNWEWAKTTNCNASCASVSIGVDASGNSYTVGYFQKTCDFDPGPAVYNLICAGSQDIFILKLDSMGNFVWARKIGDIGYDNVSSIKVDDSSNIYVTGCFGGIVDFDPDSFSVYNLVSTGWYDAFVAKYDSAGNLIWAKRMGGTTGTVSYSIDIDGSDNVYVAGNFYGTADFNPDSGVFGLTTNGYEDIFVVKLNSIGSFIWAFNVGSSLDDEIWKIVVEKSGANNILITGAFQDSVDFDPGPGTSYLTATALNANAFISKMDSSGNLIWAKELLCTAYDHGISVCLDGQQNIYATGFFIDTIDVDPGAGKMNFFSNGEYDIYILKLDSNGTFIWADQIGGPDYDTPFDMIQDSNGNINIAGTFKDTVDFDPGPGILNINCSPDFFILNLNQNGIFNWVKVDSGIGGGGISAIQINSKSQIYLTGTYVTDSLAFDTTLLINNDFLRETYIAKLSVNVVTSDETYSQKNDIKLFPNPNDGTFEIVFNNEQGTRNAEVRILNAMGQIVFYSLLTTDYSQNTTGHSQIKTQLPNGIYSISITTNNGIISKRIEVIH